MDNFTGNIISKTFHSIFHGVVHGKHAAFHGVVYCLYHGIRHRACHDASNPRFDSCYATPRIATMMSHGFDHGQLL